MRRRSRLERFFHIELSRKSAISLHIQLVTQITLHIVTGVLKPGDKLPSVRAMARRLKIHHNTVSAAYSELAQRQLVEMRHGSGVYVSENTAVGDDTSELDTIIRSFLETARKKGYSLQAIRNGVSNWLARQPPDHLLVIEPATDLQQILVHELGQQLNFGVSAATLEEVCAHTNLLTGALAVATAYHGVEIKRSLPATAMLVTLNLQVGEAESQQLKRLPLGALVGLISIGPTVLEYAQVIIASLRGEDLLVRPVLYSAVQEWRALARTADLLIADSCCYEKVARYARKTILQLRLIPPQIARYLRATLKSSLTMVGEE
ncbi:MAG: GntR family transcriptional regulator [Acidobacteriota bacterium]